MPSKARPAAAAAKPTDSTDAPPEVTTDVAGGDGATEGADETVTSTAAASTGDDGAALPPAEEPAEPPRPGLYRFGWPYPCTYLLPDRTSKPVEPGEEVFWPAGAPDALWEYVSDEPAPAPSDNTPRE